MNQENTSKNIFEAGRMVPLIFKFAVPSVISMLVNSLYNIVDQIFIGHGVGYLGNAATNVSFPLATIAMALALLIGDGSAANVSLKLGAKDEKAAAQCVGNGLTFSTILGVLLLVFGSLFLKPILLLCGATPEVLPLAQEYASITLLGIPFVVLGTTLNCIIRSDGSPRYSMFAMIIGAIINTILDPIFIFVFHWGVAGAAYATIIGQIASCIFNLFYLSRFQNIHLKRHYFKLKWSVSFGIMSLGISSFINQMAITVVQIVMNNSLTTYGAASPYGSNIPLSALGIVMKVNQILMAFLIGISIGNKPIAGYNYGARRFDRVKKSYLISASFATGVAIIGFLVFMFFPQSIINLFGQEDALYNEFAQKCFRVFLMMIFLAGFQVVSSTFFQSIGKPLISIVLSLSRQVLFLVPLLIILPIFFGLDGILYAGPIADTAAFLLALGFIIWQMRKLDVMHAQQLTGEAGSTP